MRRSEERRPYSRCTGMWKERVWYATGMQQKGGLAEKELKRGQECDVTSVTSWSLTAAAAAAAVADSPHSDGSVSDEFQYSH